MRQPKLPTPNRQLSIDAVRLEVLRVRLDLASGLRQGRCPAHHRVFAQRAPTSRPGEPPRNSASNSTHRGCCTRPKSRFQDKNWPLSWVGVAGFEPAASSSRTKRAAKLRYTPPPRTRTSVLSEPSTV